MRLIILFVILIGSLWGGYWFIAAGAMEKSLRSALIEIPSQEVALKFDTLSTRGFPNRFDTTITEIDMRDRSTGLGWQAPFIQLFSLSYKPNHVIAVWPNAQRIITPAGEIDVRSEDMRASAVFGARSALPLVRARLNIDGLKLADSRDSAIETDIDNVFIATRQAIAQRFAHDLSISANGIAVSPDRDSALYDFATSNSGQSTMRLDATLTFDGPIALRNAPPVLEELLIKKANAIFGPIEISASGTLSRNMQGFAEGTIDIEVQQWRQAFDLLADLGFVQPAWKGALEPVAQRDGDADVLRTPIVFRNGTAYLGPLAIGAAPRLNY